jgi:hypothetical protein
MGVEYAHYLIPRDNTFKPSPELLARLIDALVANGFLPNTSDAGAAARPVAQTGTDYDFARPECALHVSGCAEALFTCPSTVDEIQSLGEQDYRIVCSVSDSKASGLDYPLEPFPEFDDVYYDLEIHMGIGYIYHVSENIAPFDSVACQCGKSLEYFQYDDDDELIESAPAFTDFRIQRTCPSCGALFRPQDKVTSIKDGWTGEASQLVGGATYLFAVVVDCGKGFAREGRPTIRAAERFRQTVETALGQEIYEVGDYS